MAAVLSEELLGASGNCEEETDAPGPLETRGCLGSRTAGRRAHARRPPALCPDGGGQVRASLRGGVWGPGVGDPRTPHEFDLQELYGVSEGKLSENLLWGPAPRPALGPGPGGQSHPLRASPRGASVRLSWWAARRSTPVLPPSLRDRQPDPDRALGGTARRRAVPAPCPGSLESLAAADSLSSPAVSAPYPASPRSDSDLKSPQTPFQRDPRVPRRPAPSAPCSCRSAGPLPAAVACSLLTHDPLSFVAGRLTQSCQSPRPVLLGSGPGTRGRRASL